MISIVQAFDKILSTVEPLEAVSLPLADVLGLTLAEDVSAPGDSPPFDKSLMDGFAMRAADVANGLVSLRVIEVVTAGRLPTKPVGPGEATQIMTGAPIPDGADLVVKIEETVVNFDGVYITTKSVTPGTNILRRGTSVREGDVVLKAGMKLNGSRIGALAELGRATVQVHRRPTVAVLATGDELVPIDETPGPGQIRNSNEAMLVAQIQAAGAIPVPLGIASDSREALREKILWGLRCDMLVLSGGVSAGMLDLVPSELASAGVGEVFHKVELKPGKPVWFGRRELSVRDELILDADEFSHGTQTTRSKFTLDNFLKQMQMVRRMGNLADFFKTILGSGESFDTDVDFRRIETILNAMSPEERQLSESIGSIRCQQIACESGASSDEVKQVLRDFQSMAAMMEKMAGMGMSERMKNLRKLSQGEVTAGVARPESAKGVELVRKTTPVEDSERATHSKCHVFGLPGNPVSSLVCCELFVRTAIRRLMGEQPPKPRPMPARLEHDYSARADRPTYHPAKLMWSPEGAVVKLVPWHGSSDLCGTVAANAMAFLSGEAKEYRAGDVLEVIAW